MRWDLDKLEERWQHEKRRVQEARQIPVAPTFFLTEEGDSLPALLNRREMSTEIEVIPRHRSERITRLARSINAEHLLREETAVLRVKIDCPGIGQYLIPSYHESWPEGYKDYIRHMGQVVSALRARGHSIKYRYFDETLKRFIEI